MSKLCIRTHEAPLSLGSSNFDCLFQMKKWSNDLLGPLANGNSKHVFSVSWEITVFFPERNCNKTFLCPVNRPP